MSLCLSFSRSLSLSLFLTRSHTHTHTSHVLRYCRSTGLHLLNTLRNIPILQVSTSLHLFYSTTTYYRSTRCQNPKSHTITTGHHVTTSPYILFSTRPTTHYRSTGQHVVKTSRTFRIISIPQITMSPPHHIAYSLLLPTTGQHVIKTLRIIPVLQVIMSPPRHISFPLAYYYLLQVYRSTRRQNPQIHTLLQVNMSPPRHISYPLLLPTTGLQVNRSPKPSGSYSTTGQHVPTSPYILFSTITYYRSTGQHVVKTLTNIPIPQVTMSPPRYISHSLLLPTTCLQVNTSSKPSQAYHYYMYRSPCHHLTMYRILYYYLLHVYRSTRRQNHQNYTITTGHHVTTSPYILFSTTT